MPNEFNLKEESEFIQASSEGNVDKLSALFNANQALINTPASNGSIPLMFSAEQGHLAAIEWLVRHGATIDAVSHEKTALFFASASGKWDAVEKLLELGATDVDSAPTTVPFMSVLAYAILAGKWDIVTKLMQKGAANVGNFDETLIWEIAANEQWDLLRLFLERGAKNINYLIQGMNPLFLATANRQWKIAETLVRMGAKHLDVCPVDHFPLNALNLAVLEGKYTLTQTLLEFGAAIDVLPHPPLKALLQHMSNQLNDELLHMYTPIIDLLSAVSALFFHARNQTGTPEELNGLLNILGPALNGCQAGKTILGVALEKQYMVLVELLVSRGANRLDSEGQLLYWDGEIHLPQWAERTKETPVMQAFAKLGMVKSFLQENVSNEISHSSLEKEHIDNSERKENGEKILKEKIRLQRIERASADTLDAALNLEEPSRSDALFQLGRELKEALPFTRPILGLTIRALKNVQSNLFDENHQHAHSLLVELSLGFGDEYRVAAETLGIYEGDPTREQIYSLLVAQRKGCIELLPRLARGFVLRDQHYEGAITPLPSESGSLAEVLVSAFEHLRKEVDKLKSGILSPNTSSRPFLLSHASNSISNLTSSTASTIAVPCSSSSSSFTSTHSAGI